MKTLWVLLLTLSTALVSGCASMLSHGQTHQSASVVDYLYPGARQAPQLQSEVTTLRPPLHVGLAFVPGGHWSNGSITPADRARLLERMRAAFIRQPFIGSIEVIPDEYLRPEGGFANLEQVSRLFGVDVMVLVSYDQVQFNDVNALGMLYWTLVGAYVIHGDQYDIQTMVEASVFDVQSHKLLLRAPGTSQVKGSATMVGFDEKSRAARVAGYNEAVDKLNEQLTTALEAFKARLKTDASIRVEPMPGHSGGGALEPWSLLALSAIAAFGLRRRARAVTPSFGASQAGARAAR